MADDRQTTGETGGTGATGVSLAGPARPASPKPETNMTSDEMLNRAREVFDIEIEGLRRTRESLGESFTKAVELMLRCVSSEGIIVVTGVGKNLAVAEKISAIFASTGTRSIVLNPVQAMHGDLGMVSAGDVLLALSFSGESDEILRLIPAIRRHGLKVISLTGRPESNLAAMSDIHVEIPCGKEACPFGMAPTNSTTATMAMGDALAMVMLDAMKFDVSSYAMNHPAGAIGRALVLKVTDVMRTGERMASVAPESTVMDALMAMTKAKSGSAVIADGEGKLLGIFTDGDFRRAMSQHGGVGAPAVPCAQSDSAAPCAQSASGVSNGIDGQAAVAACGHAAPHSIDGQAVLGQPVSSYMTRSPLFVRDNAYASELLKIFERRRIDDLPVCDGAGRVVGVVDIQDLPKMKVL
ncbi:MAG: KpsF/GutQ family sugar-phosphate isomerase [Kiritimatiellae bacterium]|nr:KpsF/GutQ family sugar-phosphate isomerase [Kiritimatiellia bacterium]